MNFKLAPKETRYLGYFSIKNRPIWSHWIGDSNFWTVSFGRSRDLKARPVSGLIASNIDEILWSKLRRSFIGATSTLSQWFTPTSVTRFFLVTLTPTFTDRANLQPVSLTISGVFFANLKCDRCQFHWLWGYLFVAMAVNILLTYPDLT